MKHQNNQSNIKISRMIKQNSTTPCFEWPINLKERWRDSLVLPIFSCFIFQSRKKQKGFFDEDRYWWDNNARQISIRMSSIKTNIYIIHILSNVTAAGERWGTIWGQLKTFPLQGCKKLKIYIPRRERDGNFLIFRDEFPIPSTPMDGKKFPEQ